jgi:peptidyl-prolyl cis-trans isomerase C
MMIGAPALAQKATTPPAPATPSTPAAKAPATPAAKAPVISPTAIAAIVNGKKIYEVAVSRDLENVIPSKRAVVRLKNIDLMIDNLLIDEHLVAQGIKVDNAAVEKRMDEVRTEATKAGKDFFKMLAEYHITEAEFRGHVAAEIRWYKYAETQATDKILQELFTANKDMFDHTRVRAHHILLSPASEDAKGIAAVQEKLLAIKKDVEAKVAAGLAKLPANIDNLGREKARATLTVEAFAAHAKEKSECPTKAQGGEVGEFEKAPYMEAPFAQTAFSLKPYEISGVVHTPFGYHLIMVTERKPGRDIKFEEVKEVVKEAYFERLRHRLAGQVRAKAKIVINPAPKS